MFCHGNCIASGRGKYGNASMRGFGDVDIVVAGAVIGDYLQSRRGVEAFSVHDPCADNQCIRCYFAQRIDHLGLIRGRLGGIHLQP